MRLGNVVKATPSTWFAAAICLAGAEGSGTSSFSIRRRAWRAMVEGKPVFTHVMATAAVVVSTSSLSNHRCGGSSYQIAAVSSIPGRESAQRRDTELDIQAIQTGGSRRRGRRNRSRSRTGKDDRHFREWQWQRECHSCKVTLRASVEPRSATARTGDVVRFIVHATSGQVDNYAVRWTVNGPAATIDPDGGFVAELPGSYVITAASGSQEAIASVVVTPRNVERSLEVIGRAPIKDFEAAEEWIIGNYAYLSTISDKLLVYDISDPLIRPTYGHDKVDARIINDVSTTADGRIL